MQVLHVSCWIAEENWICHFHAFSKETIWQLRVLFLMETQDLFLYQNGHDQDYLVHIQSISECKSIKQ